MPDEEMDDSYFIDEVNFMNSFTRRCFTAFITIIGELLPPSETAVKQCITSNSSAQDHKNWRSDGAPMETNLAALLKSPRGDSQKYFISLSGLFIELRRCGDGCI